LDYQQTILANTFVHQDMVLESFSVAAEPCTYLSLTGIMEPPLIGVMEPV
jgi:hypothetical protein